MTNSPAFGIGLTLLSFLVAKWIAQLLPASLRGAQVGLAILFCVIVLSLTGVDYFNYLKGAEVFLWMLGPCTICLAFPLSKQLGRLRQDWEVFGTALVFGCLIGICSAWAISLLFDAERAVTLSVLSKSVTSAIAISISEQIGALPALSAALVILTGTFGAMVAPPVLNALRIHDSQVRGFVVGISSHGIGTAAVMSTDVVAGAYAGLAMSLNGILTAAIVPSLVRFFPNSF